MCEIELKRLVTEFLVEDNFQQCPKLSLGLLLFL